MVRGHHQNRKAAWLQLAVFVLGGLLTPTLHRASHVQHTPPVPAEACDHAQHGVAFEHAVPSYDDDLCALCSRHLLSPVIQAAPQAAPLDLAARVLAEGEQINQAAARRQRVRGPPSRT